MRHLRLDYEAIQPWPDRRPHTAKVGGEVRNLPADHDGEGVEPLIPEDEPVFLLRAKDRSAPDLVRKWADANEHDPEVAEAVRAWADAMEDYAIQHYDGGKAPDTPHQFIEGLAP